MNIEELAGLGKIVKEVEPIKGLKVKFHSLSVKEEAEVNASLASQPNDVIARCATLQIETLCRAIESIGNKTFYDINELRKYLESLQRHVLGILWEAWVNEIDKSSAQQIDDLKKNSTPPVAV